MVWLMLTRLTTTMETCPFGVTCGFMSCCCPASPPSSDSSSCCCSGFTSFCPGVGVCFFCFSLTFCHCRSYLAFFFLSRLYFSELLLDIFFCILQCSTSNAIVAGDLTNETSLRHRVTSPLVDVRRRARRDRSLTPAVCRRRYGKDKFPTCQSVRSR